MKKEIIVQLHGNFDKSETGRMGNSIAHAELLPDII
jgi:hypothetical protein